jgi:hypothetical protein
MSSTTNTTAATNEHGINIPTNDQTAISQPQETITTTVPLNVDPVMTIFPDDQTHATPSKSVSKKKLKKSSKSGVKSTKKKLQNSKGANCYES